VVRKGAGKGKARAEAVRAGDAPAQTKPKEAEKPLQAQAQPLAPHAKKGGRKGRKRRAPRTAAIVITCPDGKYKEVLRLAMDQVDPASQGIEGMSAR